FSGVKKTALRRFGLFGSKPVLHVLPSHIRLSRQCKEHAFNFVHVAVFQRSCVVSVQVEPPTHQWGHCSSHSPTTRYSYPGSSMPYSVSRSSTVSPSSSMIAWAIGT